jgi:chromosome segregation ATPase
MSDSNTYFNAFVDAAVGSIHEYVALTLQLKAKLKLANDLLAEKDNSSDQLEELRLEKDTIIADLTHQIEIIKDDKSKSSGSLQNELNTLRNQLNDVTLQLNDKNNNFNTLQNELNTLRNQSNDVTSQLNDKNNNFNTLQNELNFVRNQLTEINAQFNDKSNSFNAVQNELNVVRNQLNEANEKLNAAKSIEESFHGMKNKVQHMDTLTKQYTDLKNQYATLVEQNNLAKDETQKLTSEAEVKPSKKIINTKVKQKETKDDF